MMDIVSSTQTVLAQLASGMAKQSTPPATLYVLATPIGNRADLTVRAVYILHLADVIAAEDTRVAGQLLSSLGLHKPLLACDSHREAAAVADVVTRLSAGQRVVLCSDAGTPAISDPGARLVAGVRAAGFRILPIPGASSLTAAVSASGLVEEGLQFHAFAPSKGASRKDFYAQLAASSAPQVWFEAPHRMADACDLLASLAPLRNLCIARELTKQFEQIITLPTQESPAWLAASADHGRGEFVLILGKAPATGAQGEAALALALAQLLVTELPTSKAAALAAKHYGAERSEVYAGLMQQKTAQSNQKASP